MDFKDVFDISDENILAQLPISEAIDICEKALARQNNSALDIMILWTRKLFKVYGISRFSEEDCQQLISLFGKINHNVVSQDIIAANANFNSLLSECLKLAHFAWKFVDSTEAFYAMFQFIVQVAISVSDVYMNCNADNADNVLRTTHEMLSSLSRSVFQILGERLDSGDVGINALGQLCYLAERTPRVNIKVSLDIWKSITKAIIVTYHSGSSLELKRATVLLIAEIDRNIALIYEKDILKQDEDQVEKYLRVTNFYLKLLFQITQHLNHTNFPATEELLQSFYKSKCLPKTLQGTFVQTLTERYIWNVFDDILKEIYMGNQVQQVLIRYMEKEKIKSWIMIKSYLLVCISERDPDCTFISNNSEFFATLFERIIEDCVLFMSSEDFDFIIEIYATLILSSSNYVLEHRFKSMVFSSNFYISHTSAEIFLIVARQAQAQNQTELLDNLEFWRRCNDRFALLSTNSKRFDVQRLLMHYFALCRTCGKLSKSDILNRCGRKSVHSESYLSAGMPVICVAETTGALKSLHSKISAELIAVLNSFYKESSVEGYYKIIFRMTLLSNTAEADISHRDELFQTVTEFLLRILEFSPEKQTRFYAFHRAAFGLLTALNCVQKNENLLQNILTYTKSKGRIPCSVEFINFLHACCKEIHPKLQEVSARLLDSFKVSNNCYEFMRLVCLRNQLHTYQRTAQHFKLLLTRITHINRCSERCCLEVTQPNKRPRLTFQDNAESDVNVKHLLHYILEKSRSILELKTSLDRYDMWTIKCIAHNISMALNKK